MAGIPDFLKVIRPTDFVAEVKSIKWLNEKVCSIWYSVVDGKFEFEAGQFVNLKFIDRDDGSEIQRAYSVASAPAGKSGARFELCIEIIDGGKAGKYFSEIQVGDESKFKGPFGFCTLPDNAVKSVLVGTGTGIAPIKAILEDVRNKRSETSVEVLFGFRHWKDRFYLDVLNDLACEVAGNFYVCISREDIQKLEELGEFENLQFIEGRVTSLLSDEFWKKCSDKKRGGNLEEVHVYICGGSAMIKDVREISLQAGVDKRNVHVEIFD